jgi:hypothetical protein
MAEAISIFAVATIESTSAGPGSKPSVTITSTGNFTSTNGILISQKTNVKDVEGDIRLEWTRVDDDNITVYATRQLPAGKSIGFWWLSASQ